MLSSAVCGDGGLYQYVITMTDRSYLLSFQVRIFPYLIGRESAFAENLKWMACANKGGASNTCMEHAVLLYSLSHILCVCVCMCVFACACVCVVIDVTVH